MSTLSRKRKKHPLFTAISSPHEQPTIYLYVALPTMKGIFLVFFLLFTVSISGQSTQDRAELRTSMVLKGRVLNEDGTPITGANIEGQLGRYTTTDARGYFSIPANMGEEVVIRGLGFETVYYRIKSLDDLEIRVQDQDENRYADLSFAQAMDSARVYFNKDAQKTADLLIAGLSNNPKKLKNSEQAQAYELLGDLYVTQQQYDLAADSYEDAIQYKKSVSLSIKKANSLQRNGNYQEALKIFEDLKARKSLEPNQRIAILRGLASIHEAIKSFQKSIDTYTELLESPVVLENKTLTTNLKTELASVYDKAGKKVEAQKLINESITVSEAASPVLNIAAKSNAAQFYNANQNYEEEINLRRQNIDQINALKKKEIKSNIASSDTIGASNTSNPETLVINSGYLEDADLEEVVVVQDMVADEPTVQGEQLKIGAALKNLNKDAEALEYFKSSLEEASASNDLEVQKEASRELYEIYRKRGNSRKALDYNDLYVAAVDALYAEKENELEESARRTKELLARQNRIDNLEKDRRLTENKLALINAENQLTEETNQRQQWVIYSLIALSLLLISLAFFMYRNNQQQKVNNRLLALKSLRSQMNPHFIFNALNSVNSYISLNDERAANKYLADFSKLMRNVLENSELDFIPLQKELELLKLYLKLEHERFKDQFDYEVTIAPEVKELHLEVPPMLLQPIIENAVWHGLRYKKAKGLLSVKVEKVAGQKIQVEITDDGIGREKSKALKTEHQKKRTSKGLGNIENRVALLNELHDYHIDMKVEDAGLSPDVGTRVVVVMGI